MESGNDYVGLDVSLKQTSICVVDQTGSVVREGVVDLDPEAISVYVRSKAPDAVRIGLETGPTSTWLWTELKQLGLPVICIDALPKAEVYPQQSVQPATRHPSTWAQQAPRRLGTTRTRTDADGSRAIRNGRFQRPVPQLRRQKHQS